MTTQLYDPQIQGWNLRRALKALDITEVPFDLKGAETNHAHACGREIGVCHDEAIRTQSKRALGYSYFPILHSYLHEIAHVVLGHTESETDDDYTESQIQAFEMEVELVVTAVADLLNLDDTGDIPFGATPTHGLVNRRGSKSHASLAANLWKFAVRDEVGGELPAPIEIIDASAAKVEQAAAAIAAAGVSK